MKSQVQIENAKWPKVKLSDVAEQCLGKMLDAKKNKGQLMPYLRNPNVRWFEVDTSDLRLMPFEDHEHDRYGLKAGDIVICEGGEAGRAAIWDGRLPDLKFQKAIHRVRPHPRLHNRFFVHRLMADHQNGGLDDYLTGTTIKHFTGQDLARYEFPLPPLSEQRRIAEVLDRGEALRAKRRAALAQLDTLTQSIFFDLFGALSAGEFTNMTLGEAVEVVTVGHVGPTSEFFCEDGIPFLRTGNVGRLEILEDNLKLITPEFHRRLKKSCLKRGDVLVSRVISDEVRCAVVPDKFDGANCANVIVIRPGAKMAGEYLAQLIHEPRSQASFLRRRVGSAQSVVNTGVLQDWEVPVPYIELQREFARRVAAVEKLKAVQRTSLDEMDALFTSLQHRAFRGEL